MKQIIINELKNDFAELVFNNPAAYNALSDEMASEFQEKITELISKGKKYRALIIRGEGKAFSAGGDLQMLLAKTKFSTQKNRELMIQFYNSFLSILDLPFPVVAKINGVAVGAGLALACACDLRIATEEAKFGFGFSKLGLHPGMGTTFFVPALIGKALAMELILSSRMFLAEYAQQIGLVSKVFPSQSFEEASEGYLKEIFGNAPEASSQFVHTLRVSRTTLNPYLENEAKMQSINYASAEFLEGVTAMLEKRSAKFML